MEELKIENGRLITCTSREAQVIVPDGVVRIGKGAFKGCTSIKQIILPQSVEVIEEHAFKGCRKLEFIAMPENVKEIGDYAFHRCHGLKEIELPPKIERLGNCVFLYCDSLRRVKMEGVKHFGRQAFLNDVALSEIWVNEELDKDSICECFTGCNKIEKIYLCGRQASCYEVKNTLDILSGKQKVLPAIEVIIKDIYRILEIEDGVLTKYLNNVKHIELPEGITAIGKSCFYDKRGICSIVFPNSLKSIEEKAFRGCIGLSRVTFLSTDVQIKKAAFLNCSALQFIAFSGGKEYEIKGLAQEDFLGEEIFGTEKRQRELVHKIHQQMLDNFVLSDTMLLKYKGCETKVVVPEGVEIIGQRAFAGNEGIDRIELPKTVTYIEREAFADCVLMQTIQLSEEITEIEEGAFKNCVKLIRVELPKKIKTISVSCFKRCHSLVEVKTSGDLENICDMAFYECEKLQTVYLPEEMEYLGDMAFTSAEG